MLEKDLEANNLQVFSNSEFGNIRTITIDNEPWFVGKDVAEALGYQNGSKAVIDHVDREDKQFLMASVSDSQNGNVVKTAVINESGLYALIFGSKLESAKRFKRWVTREVLPAIRKHGYYTSGKSAENQSAGQGRPLTTDDYLEASRIVAGCKGNQLKMVASLLEQGGFKFDTVQNRTRWRISEPQIPEPVQEYLSQLNVSELIDVPTTDVYNGYLSFCAGAGYNPVEHKLFSRCVNRTFETHSAVRKINGICVRVYRQ